jgi:hypothetical protein
MQIAPKGMIAPATFARGCHLKRQAPFGRSAGSKRGERLARGAERNRPNTCGELILLGLTAAGYEERAHAIKSSFFRKERRRCGNSIPPYLLINLPSKSTHPTPRADLSFVATYFTQITYRE